MFGQTSPGQSHNKQNPLRWDTSTAACLLALGALAFLVFVNFNVGASASLGASRR